jgi:hypothetical protein
MIDLFPEMPLEMRAYLLLGLIGGIFFIAIIVLAIGNVRNNLRRAKEYDSTEMHMTQEKPKKEKPKKKPKKEKPKKEKKPLFGKKKDEAVDMLAIPAGYEPDEEDIEEEEEEIVFAPSGVGEVIDDELPDDWLTSPSPSAPEQSSPFGGGQSFGAPAPVSNEAEEDEADYSDESDLEDGDDFTTPQPEDNKKRSQDNGSSPFGGGVGLDI